MKILIIMAGFFPGKKYGGPPVSVDNFCTLMQENDCYIVCKDHDMGDNTRYSGIYDGWNERSNCKVQYLCDDEYKENGFEKIIEELHPDLLYLQGMFQSCVLPCLRLAKKYDIKVLLAPRGELCVGAFQKKYKKIPYLRALKALGLTKNIHFQSTSAEETTAIQKWFGVSESKIHYLTNIPSIPKETFPHQKKVAGSAKLIFLSRIVWKKNLLFALQCLSEVTGNVQFDIYGPIEDEEYWDKCQQEIAIMPDNIQVNYCGLVGHEDVHKTFANYDAFFFPTLSENFGHVIVEALMVGCPVIISDQTPWNDINDYNCGGSFSLEKPKMFVDMVQSIVSADDNNMETYRENIKVYVDRKLKVQDIKKQYHKVLLEIL